MKSETFVIFCDGAAKGNPGPGGWGAIVASDVHVSEIGGSEKNTTNNKMELTAAIHALRLVPRNGAAEVHTDSAYVVNGITKWVKGWMRNDWKTAAKKPVENRDLWEDLYEETQGKNIAWKLVPGHSGVAGNERVDEIASTLALRGTIGLYEGSRDEYMVMLDGRAPVSGAIKKKSTAGSGKAYSYVSMVNGKIETHKTWSECEARVKGKQARFRKALSADDEQRIIAEFKAKK